VSVSRRRFPAQYSPDFNPIEIAFAKRKTRLGRIAARSFDDRFAAIGDACRLFDPDECWNFFKAAGYAPD
jgi:transposase